jgi:hypothetical protein
MRDQKRGALDSDEKSEKGQSLRCSASEEWMSSPSTDASYLVDPNHEYEFILGGDVSVGYSSTVLNTFVATDPSSTGWNSPEWTFLQSLFGEIKLVHFKITIVNTLNSDSFSTSNNFGAVFVASNLSAAANPGSYGVLADNADAKIWSGLRDSSPHGHTHEFAGTNLNYSTTSSVATSAYAGCPGSIQFYSAASASISNCFHIHIRGVYRFRSRI